MIEKARLEELIKQGAVIYDIFQGDVFLVDLTMAKYYEQPVYIEYSNDYYHGTITRDNNDLFETKEEAEEYLEFGYVTRTERLKMPSWKELENKNESVVCKFLGNDLYWYAIMQFNVGQGWVIYNMNTKKIVGKFIERTKENYIKTRRLAVKLFKGEKL